MNRLIILACTIPIFFLCSLFVIYIKIVSDETVEFEQVRLQKALNYATDAATTEMIYVGHLQMDREDRDKEMVNPSIALETFCDVFALNYGLPITDTSRILIQSQYLPVFAVAAYDGIYIYTKQEPGSVALVSTPKIPYTYNDNGILTALNFGIKHAIYFDGYDIKNRDITLSKEEVLRIINARISSLFAEALDKEYTAGFTNRFYIPDSLTNLYATNPVSTVSVLAFVDNLDLNHLHKYTDFSVGGARVSELRRVVVYNRDGTNYYCYADLYEGNTNNIIDEYNNTTEAAQAGYHYDPEYMG
jgi:hypothetical protein